MILGITIVRHFDLVNYILKKYRMMMITEIAEVFCMDVLTVYGVYHELGIDPLEIAIKNYKENVPMPVSEDLNASKEVVEITKQYMHITPSKREPNREPVEITKRADKNYSQNSPYGIADELHNNPNSFTEKPNDA